ncbi:MAG: alcohol dehydrogenase catalytic domain-containing protein [Anaerolineales bacterium]|nr:alcohol dehydrogenase catalytic domain-containing protein [Anaerolineales bacterium]
MKMKTARLHDIGKIQIGEEPVPQPKEGKIILRITAVGICGSDIHWFSDGGTGASSLSKPLILGHEFAAIAESGKYKGKPVAVDPMIPCGKCEYCLKGRENLCIQHDFAGQTPVDGAMREYMTWPEELLFPVPESFSPAETAMLEPLGVAIHTTRLADVSEGDVVGVYGCGPIGLMVVQLLKLKGVKTIIATDLLPHRIQKAQELGANCIFQAEKDSREIDGIYGATRGRGVDIAIEIAGSNAAVHTAVETVIPGGKVILCGIPSIDEVVFKASTSRRKELTLQCVRRMLNTYPEAIQLVKDGLVDVKSLVSKEYSLEDIDKAFVAASKREGFKLVVCP